MLTLIRSRLSLSKKKRKSKQQIVNRNIWKLNIDIWLRKQLTYLCQTIKWNPSISPKLMIPLRIWGRVQVAFCWPHPHKSLCVYPRRISGMYVGLVWMVIISFHWGLLFNALLNLWWHLWSFKPWPPALISV